MEIAGCPSCPPQGVLVVGFHHPDRRAWNRELLGLVPGGREVHPTGAAAIPEGGWRFSSVKGTPILGSHEGLGGARKKELATLGNMALLSQMISGPSHTQLEYTSLASLIGGSEGTLGQIVEKVGKKL